MGSVRAGIVHQGVKQIMDSVAFGTSIDDTTLATMNGLTPFPTVVITVKRCKKGQRGTKRDTLSRLIQMCWCIYS